MNKLELMLEDYPDGISEALDTSEFDEDIFDRGYYLELEEGTWYEMFVTDVTKEDNPELTEEDLEGFDGLWLGDYEENSQITFFVPVEEEEFDLQELTDLLC